ncbi:13782_t:CDS:1, partial [Racocetra fulgida]
MSLQSYLLFLNIFEKTHEELVSLNSAYNQLLIAYKSQKNLEIDNNNSELNSNLLLFNNSKLEDNSLLINSNDNPIFNFNSVLSKIQIDTYHQIYMKQPFENDKNEELNSIKSIKKQLSSQKEEAYLHRLSTN